MENKKALIDSHTIIGEEFAQRGNTPLCHRLQTLTKSPLCLLRFTTMCSPSEWCL